jgi:hypothetical protein
MVFCYGYRLCVTAGVIKRGQRRRQVQRSFALLRMTPKSGDVCGYEVVSEV